MSLVGGSWNWELTNPRMHLSHVLRDAGYHTRIYGYQDEAVRLDDLGFDHSSSYLGPRQPDRVIDAVEMSEDLAGFLRYEAGDLDRPFYAQIGFWETHTPYEYGGVTPDTENGVWFPPWRHERDAETEHWFAMLQGSVKKVDTGVGIILAALREAGLEENTMVLFAVDHGIDLPQAKRTMYDAGLLTGFILRWPAGGITGGRTCSWMLSNADFAATLVEMIGITPAHRMEGTSFARAFEPGVDLSDTGPRDYVYARWAETEQYAVRSHEYKLIRTFRAQRPVKGKHSPYANEAPQQLFYLPDDAYEEHDVASDPSHQAALHELNARFYEWLEATDDPIRFGPTPTPYYQDAIRDYERYRWSETHSPATHRDPPGSTWRADHSDEEHNEDYGA
jgi:arylsulfatase A-like enzyme